MNILFISAVLPYPLHSGGQIRMYNLLSRLSKKHSITLVSFIRNEEENMFKKDLSFCKSIYTVMRGRAMQPRYLLNALFGEYPWLLATYDNKEMKNLLSRLINENHFHVAHLEPFYVWPSLPELKIPFVVSEHNIEYVVYNTYAQKYHFLKPIFDKDVEKILQWEQHSWRNASRVTAVSQEDADIIQTYLSHEVNIIPNGVDLDSFPFVAHRLTSKKLLFVGNFRWLPNTQAVHYMLDNIWPLIKKTNANVTLKIIGRFIPTSLVIKARGAGCEVVENSSDIANEYQNADVLIAPHAIGGGTKFKILESFASGLPVITTSQGIQGIEAKSGIHYLEANTPNDFVNQIKELFNNPVLQKTLTKNARNLVEKNYDWDIIALHLEKVWKNA